MTVLPRQVIAGLIVIKDRFQFAGQFSEFLYKLYRLLLAQPIAFLSKKHRE